MAGGPPASVCI